MGFGERIFFGILGALFFSGGFAALLWPGPRRTQAWFDSLDRRWGWARRANEQRSEELGKWTSRPTRWWFVSLLGAVGVMGALIWWEVVGDAPLGRGTGALIGFL